MRQSGVIMFGKVEFNRGNLFKDACNHLDARGDLLFDPHPLQFSSLSRRYIMYLLIRSMPCLDGQGHQHGYRM